MSTDITPEHRRKVQAILADGSYSSEDEVLDEALALLEQRDRLRKELVVGVNELERGERVDGDEVFDALRRRLDAIEQPQG